MVDDENKTVEIEHKKHKPVCVSLKSEHVEFIQNQKKTFKLSKFIQFKLDEYIKSLNEYNKFTEVKQ